MDAKTDLIQIKGLRDGLVATLAGAPWEELRFALFTHIDARRDFFQGARLALDVGENALRVHDLVQVRDQLSDRGVALWAVVSESEVTRNTAQLLGLATRVWKPRPEDSREFAVEDLGEETALFLGRTIRSGTRIEFAGHVVVMGDVNPGAEVLAEGNIIVWGKAKGLLHAGSRGDAKAVICGLDLAGAQIRIAEYVQTEASTTRDAGPEAVSIDEAQHLHFATWRPTPAGS